MDCSPPGSSVHGISQASIPEWVAVPSSKGSSQLRDWTCVTGGFFTIWATRLKFIITLPSVSLTHSVYLFNLPLQFCSEDTKGVFPPKYPLSRPSNPLDINMIYSPCIESCYSKMPWKLAPMRKISVSLIATELSWILTWFSWVYYAYYAYTSQLEDTGFIL